MKKIAFICPYFGKLPEHCQLWLDSCAYNKDITWFLITDDRRKFNYPKNVIVKYTTLEEVKSEYQKKFDFPISLSGVYKLGDYKPLFGYLYEELLEGYDAWGHIDVADEIYGDIRKFVTDDLIEKYDKIMIFGHMCIYKNTPEVNRRFMTQVEGLVDYRTIFSSEKFYNFEEIAENSITRIYQKSNWEIGRLDDYIADISGLRYAFRLGTWSEDCNKLTYLPSVPRIFTWENGKIFGYSIEDKQLIKREYLYVHFKRRKMQLNVSGIEKEYYIIPNGFESKKGDVTVDIVKQYSKNKLFYDVYFKEKKKAIQSRILNFKRGEKI